MWTWPYFLPLHSFSFIQYFSFVRSVYFSSLIRMFDIRSKWSFLKGRDGKEINPELPRMVCVFWQLVTSIQVLWASPVHPGGGFFRRNHSCVWGLSFTSPIRFFWVSSLMHNRDLFFYFFCFYLHIHFYFTLTENVQIMRRQFHSTLTCFYQQILFLGLYATPLCLRPSPYPFRPVFGPVRRTTETSLASGTVHPLPQMSTSIPLSLSTLMWVCTLTNGSWHYSTITPKPRSKCAHKKNPSMHSVYLYSVLFLSRSGSGIQ